MQLDVDPVVVIVIPSTLSQTGVVRPFSLRKVNTNTSGVQCGRRHARETDFNGKIPS
jgi:hypothetical protein